jgi:hypothetical protein
VTSAYIPPSELTARQRRAARFLSQGMRVSDVALRIKVSPRSVARWKEIPAFAEAASDPENGASPADPTDVLSALLDSADERIALQAAQALLRLTDEGAIAPEPGKPTITIIERPAAAPV